MAETDEIVIGEIKIAGGVLERMVRESVCKVEGVSQVKNISVSPKDKALQIDVNIVVGFNKVYPEVGADVQKAVVDDISRMTGVKVADVNVIIERLDFSKE